MKTWLKIGLAVLVTVLVAQAVNPAAILETAREAHPIWVMGALLLLLPNLILESEIWYVLLRRVAPKSTRAEAFRGVLAGFPFGFVTPGRVGEFAGRTLTINTENKLGVGLSVAAARLPELLALLIAGSAALAYTLYAKSAHFPGSTIVAVVSLGAVVLLLYGLFAPARVGRIVARLIPEGRLRQEIVFLGEAGRGRTLRLAALSFARLGIFSLQFWILAHALLPSLDPLVTFNAILLTFLVKTVIPPFTFLDLGVREGAAAFFFGMFGLGASVGFSAAFGLFLINVVIPTLAGLALLWIPSSRRIDRRVATANTSFR